MLSRVSDWSSARFSFPVFSFVAILGIVGTELNGIGERFFQCSQS